MRMDEKLKSEYHYRQAKEAIFFPISIIIASYFKKQWSKEVLLSLLRFIIIFLFSTFPTNVPCFIEVLTIETKK